MISHVTCKFLMRAIACRVSDSGGTVLALVRDCVSVRK